jgi:hypothetical protein
MIEIHRESFHDGQWIARVTGPEGAQPSLAVACLTLPEIGTTTDSVPVPHSLTPGAPGQWRLVIPVLPATGGVQTYVILDAETQIVQRSFTVIGDPGAIEGDLTAEVAALRAELDLLTSSYRRYMHLLLSED